MKVNQKTLKAPFTLEGVGLHTGQMAKVTVKPAPVDTWFVFQRMDVEGSPTIKADVSNVTTTTRSTTLEQNGTEVHTTEHILAALYGMDVDNAIIEIHGSELPILDGSSKQWVDEILRVGLEEQDAEREYFYLNEVMKFESEASGAEYLAVPDELYRVTVMVDYHSPLLGTQHASMYHINEFEKELAPCRTFVFLRELVALVDAGLVKGGDADNAIVMVDREISEEDKQKLSKAFNKPASMLESTNMGILNNLELRFQNEPARHKLLDLIGDFALTGMHIRAHILTARPGHTGNKDFAKELKKQMLKQRKQVNFDLNKEAIFEIKDIENKLPHRYPMLLVDKIMELSDNHVVGVKNITRNEAVFNGHFPEEAVFPGVMIVEALAQCGGFLVLSSVPDPENYSTYFLKIDGVKFKKKVVPGDSLVLKMELIAPIRRGLANMKATAYVRNQVVAEGELLAQVSKNKD
ncbi:MAG: bifunctional UDP-3-O-[3-hydroxymyristoyl] N-acetylglucosamine deacetylase/3-hydroxyacyl-ACP dehydratase [Salibacteraceae bacterium]